MSSRGRLGVALCRANKETVCAFVCRDVVRESVTRKKIDEYLFEIHKIPPNLHFLKQESEELSALDAPSRLCLYSQLSKANLAISTCHNEGRLSGSQVVDGNAVTNGLYSQR